MPSWDKGKGHKGGKRKKGGTNYRLLTIDESDYVLAAAEGANPLSASESLVDTGATASAGGQEAVEKLCAAIAAARPNVKFEVSDAVRPYFGYGSGAWGQALYRVTIAVDDVKIAVFALPSQRVPVLLGMKELSYLNAFLGCATGRCLVGGNKVILRKTAKGHLVMDFVEHIFPKGSKAVETTSTKVFQEQPQKPKPVKKVWKWVPRTPVIKKSVKFGNKQMYH